MLARLLLGDDPAVIVAALKSAIRDGATATDLSRAITYAAALRIALFGTSNEHSDWDTALHCFTYCNGVHQLLTRITAERPMELERPELLRGVFHAAMQVYLIRFLNVPPARLPGEGDDKLDDLPGDGRELRHAFLTALDSQGAVKTAGRLVARYLILGHPAEPLIATLARAVLREDAEFHTYQILEAGVQQYRQWGESRRGDTSWSPSPATWPPILPLNARSSRPPQWRAALALVRPSMRRRETTTLKAPSDAPSEVGPFVNFSSAPPFLVRRIKRPRRIWRASCARTARALPGN